MGSTVEFKLHQCQAAFHNYKNYFSLVLMVIVDARHYRFVWIDDGDYGNVNLIYKT